MTTIPGNYWANEVLIAAANEFITAINKFIAAINKFIAAANEFIAAANKLVAVISKFIAVASKLAAVINEPAACDRYTSRPWIRNRPPVGWAGGAWGLCYHLPRGRCLITRIVDIRAGLVKRIR